MKSMPPRFTPTNEQQAILDHQPRQHARILAGPGTGKSATVIEWIARNPGTRAKLLTFTRAATAELIDKLATRQDLNLDKPSTIHSYCISVLLQNNGVGEFPRPFRMADDWETDNIVEPTLARRLGIRKRQVGELFSELAANWESLNPEENPEIDAATRARFMGGWREHREIFGYALLAELPYALNSALQDHPDLAGIDHETLVVDEYQDLNACDLSVLRGLAARGCSVIAAGDDDQSIYSFRKAHPAGIRNFRVDYTGAADYPLTITRRCARRIINWANYVIQGDAGRPADRRPLQAAEAARDGEVGLLSFAGNTAEANGIAQLVQELINVKNVPAQEILILLRGDHNGQFSRPIKTALAQREIPYSDPSDLLNLLKEVPNRRALSILRLSVHREDSLAWATLLYLTPGIGDTFFDYAYNKARDNRSTFGQAVLRSHAEGYPSLSRAVQNRVSAAITSILAELERIEVPAETPESGWGTFIAEQFPATSEPFRALLARIDERLDGDETLDRYLGQVAPIAKDIALQKGTGVRIMTLASSKGLTVKATIIAGLETGVIPMDDCDLAEERRLLYVGMTRAEEYLFCTWARFRRGPTARAGRAQVNERRQLSTFLEGGPVGSTDGTNYHLQADQ